MRRDRLRGLVAGIVAGLAGGLFGVGGGIIMIPLLTGLFGLTQHQAHGTSLAAMGAAALVATIVYAAFGHVAWTTALFVGITSVITARYGARLASRTSPGGLRRAFAAFLALVALRLLWLPPTIAAAPRIDGAMGIGFDLVLGSLVGIVSGYMG